MSPPLPLARLRPPAAAPARCVRCFVASAPRPHPMSIRQANRQQAAQIKESLASASREDQSMRVLVNRMAEKGAVPDDFGLLPDTFIMPSAAHRPSLLAMPRVRARLALARLKTRLRDYFYVLGAKWFVVKPRPKLHTRRIPAVARALHERMGHAFAAADAPAIVDTCANGLADSLLNRTRKRKPTEAWRWTLHRYRGRPRVVSHKINAMPKGDGSYMSIRQAVVKIRSVQSLSKHGEDPVERDMTEYLVLQQIYGLDEKKKEWKIWGMMDENKDLWKKYL